MSKRAEINQYEFIDALRGIAIILVIVTHVANIARPSLSILRSIAAHGAFGVQLFYIVSALTLLLSLDQRIRNEKRPIRNFFIRRLFRIVPLFYLAILAYSLRLGTGPNYWAPNGVEWWQYVLTLLFLNGWHPEAINAIVPLGWSIAIEMTFYPLLPLLNKKVKDAGGAILFIMASLILQTVLVAIFKPFLLQHVTGYVVEPYFYLWFFAQLPIFGIGILLHKLLRDQPERNNRLGAGLVSLSIFLYIAFLGSGSYLNIIPVHFYYGIVFAVLTLGLYFGPGKLIVNQFTQWIGKISYSLYLVHFILLSHITTWFPLGENIGKTTQFIIYFSLLFSLSSAISYVTYRLVEIPGVEFGKKLIHKLENPVLQVEPKSAVLDNNIQ